MKSKKRGYANLCLQKMIREEFFVKGTLYSGIVAYDNVSEDDNEIRNLFFPRLESFSKLETLFARNAYRFETEVRAQSSASRSKEEKASLVYHLQGKIVDRRVVVEKFETKVQNYNPQTLRATAEQELRDLSRYFPNGHIFEIKIYQAEKKNNSFKSRPTFETDA